MTNKLTTLCFVLTLFNSAVIAQQNEQNTANNPDNQVIIDADKQQAQLKDDILIFEQNVHIIHGKREIKADHLAAHSREALGKNKQLLIAKGKPAIYSETLADGTKVTAQANEIRYDVATETLNIKGKAKVTMGDQQIVAEEINYDITKQLITTEKAKNSNQRVRTTLTLDKKPNEQKQP